MALAYVDNQANDLPNGSIEKELCNYLLSYLPSYLPSYHPAFRPIYVTFILNSATTKRIAKQDLNLPCRPRWTEE